MIIRKELDGTVSFVEGSIFLKSLQEGVTMSVSKKPIGFSVTDVTGISFFIDIRRVTQTKIEPAAAVDFTGSMFELWKLLVNGFFDEFHNIQGGLEAKKKAFGANYNILNTDSLLYATASNISIKLPLIGTDFGQSYRVLCNNNTITVACQDGAGDLIIGKTTMPLRKYDAVTFRSISANNWLIEDYVTNTFSTTKIVSPVTGDTYYDTTDAVIKTWNGQFWVGLDVIYEDFVINTGESIHFVSATNASGATGITVSSGWHDLNTTALKRRVGAFHCQIDASLANSLSTVANSSAISAPKFRTALQGKLYVEFEYRHTNTSLINYTDDPVLACVGLLAFTASTTVNPLSGVYVRMPRVGETAFVKYVVRVAGVETVGDTTIAVASNFDGYIKAGIYWDETDMHFIVTDGVSYSTSTIVNFLTTYDFSAIVFHLCMFVARNGAAVTPSQKILHLDRAGRWFSNNYIKFA